MRISTACIACRQRKIKCVHLGTPPCNYCRSINNESDCVLYTTKDYMKIRGPRAVSKLYYFDSIKINEFEIKDSIRLALQHYPELFFLTTDITKEQINFLDPLLKLSICALVSLFDKTITDERKTLNIKLETKLLTKLEDEKVNYVLMTQCSIILLIINWQKGKTYKGYLIGGFAERAYKMLFDQNINNFPVLEREEILRTLWSYQLITLSLRDEPIELVKSRLHKFRLPTNISLIGTSTINTSSIYINSINNGDIHNLCSLLIMSSYVWIECLSWLTKGGKYYFKEEPWKSESTWNKLEEKITTFHNSLGELEKFSLKNLNLALSSSQSSSYCSMHLTLMISEILIHRDFIPFIPSDTEGAKGPFDKLPWLENAPEGWWQQSASIVFDTAKNISIILNACKQNNKYICNTFNGFIALTAASVLTYVKHFPYFDKDFENAEIYYEYCLDYLFYYKSFLEIGDYYYKILMQTEKIFDLAVKKGVSKLIITIFEQLKNEILDIANVSGPIDANENYKTQLDKLVHLERNKIAEHENEPNISDQYRQELSSLMNWDFDWTSLENYQDLWTPYIEEED